MVQKGKKPQKKPYPHEKLRKKGNEGMRRKSANAIYK